jgi:hypothetical protein
MKGIPRLTARDEAAGRCLKLIGGLVSSNEKKRIFDEQ